LIYEFFLHPNACFAFKLQIEIPNTVNLTLLVLAWKSSIDCSLVVQVENCYEAHQHIRVTQYEENLSVVDAYNNPQLQPVVVMKRLDLRYFTSMEFSVVRL